MDILEFARRDVIILHPPSVYDFRVSSIFTGPVNDVVPSSSVFEMYPVGITSIADCLEKAGYHVQVVNLAYQMLRDPEYDVEALNAANSPRLWAIDLHWLPHSQGALAVAEHIKRAHPDARVLLGGLSASYYHRELIKRPEVDFVLRGDSTEEPFLDLVRCLQQGVQPSRVPNLTWQSANGQVIVNPLNHVPDTLDGLQLPSYRYVMRSVFKYWNLSNVLPYLDWLRYPVTALLTARGCALRCATCGGSRDAYELICNRTRPAFRSPAKLIDDLRFIRRFSRAPIFVIHDIRMGGKAYAEEFLSRLEGECIDNEMIFELFYPAGDEFFSRLNRAVPRYSLELTLETHDPVLRKLNAKFPVSNQIIESTIERALENGCRRMDLFFMVGIPNQSRESVLESIDYAGHLLERFGEEGRLQVYVAPLAPFLDPGSRAFESPARFGYRLLASTLEEHRSRLLQPAWTQLMNYESQSLPPRSLVDTTYEATARLTRLKARHGLLSEEMAHARLELIEQARRLTRRLDEAEGLSEAEKSRLYAKVRRYSRSVSESRMYDQSEFVSWGDLRIPFRPLGIMKLMIELFVEELRHAWTRLRGRNYRWRQASDSAQEEVM